MQSKALVLMGARLVQLRLLWQRVANCSTVQRPQPSAGLHAPCGGPLEAFASLGCSHQHHLHGAAPRRAVATAARQPRVADAETEQPSPKAKAQRRTAASKAAVQQAPVARVEAQAATAAVATALAQSTEQAQAGATYDATHIQVLDGLEPVRKRPGMYIGSTGQRGLHHLVYEVLDNAIDEVQAGHASLVDVEVDLTTGWVTIRDNGRGIPTDVHPKTGKSALETVLTVLHAGGKFGGESSGYKVSGGLHGVGISVVNALSRHVEVKVWRAGRQYKQSFSRGVPQGPLEESAAEVDAAARGTQVRFLYDDTIFSKGVAFDPETIRSRLRELAFLNSRATIRFRVIKNGKALPVPNPTSTSSSSSSTKSRASKATSSSTAAAATVTGKVSGSEAAAAAAAAAADAAVGWQVFHYEGGIREFVSWMNEGKEAMHEPVYFTRMSEEGVRVEGALQWCADGFSDELVGFANSIRTVDGGTHLEGLKSALTRTVNATAKKQKLVKDGEVTLNGEHIREGLSAIVSVAVPDPEFEGQTKTRLGNPGVKKIVDTATAEALGEWLETHPAALSTILAKAMQAAKAAEAAKKARELVRRKSVLTRSTLPGKLADCTSSNRDDTEIFLVEGDSAGGSAKQARDRHTQAVLPLRGKILNVERKDDAALLKNNEIANIIVALGLGSKGEPLASLRYKRIIILTDADVDGAHIRTLLLTFLFRFRRELFEQGHVYVAVPPLYRLELTAAGTAALAAAEAAADQQQQQQQQGSGAATQPTTAAATAATAAGAGAGDAAAAKAPARKARSSKAKSAAAAASGGDAGSGASSSSAAGGSAAPRAGPSSRWCYSDAEMREATAVLPPGSFTLQRFKGLGEMMPEQLWNTTLNPQTRQLRRLTLDDAAAASHVFTVLMGDKVAPRRQLIEEQGARYSLEELDV